MYIYIDIYIYISKWVNVSPIARCTGALCTGKKRRPVISWGLKPFEEETRYPALCYGDPDFKNIWRKQGQNVHKI